MLLNCGSGKDPWESPCTERRSNQSIIREINLEYSLEALMLKLQYFGHVMQRANSLEKTDAGKDWRQEEKGTTTENEVVGWNHWLDGHGFELTPGDNGGQSSLACCRPWGCKEFNTFWSLKQWNTRENPLYNMWHFSILLSSVLLTWALSPKMQHDLVFPPSSWGIYSLH